MAFGAELAEAMNDLRVSPHDLDPDEVIRLFVPEAHTVDQQKDRRLWILAQKLAEAFSAHAAAARFWLSTANESACSRVTPNSVAMISAEMPCGTK